MATATITNRPCERQCRTCGKFKHYSRFRRRLRETPQGTLWEFDLDCRACQQIARNETKNQDRARAIIEGRAAIRARVLGVTKDFMMNQMNWIALVPIFRSQLTPEARCLNCGHPYENERDIQIDHIDPPPKDGGLAFESARNLRFLCGACNAQKNARPNLEWLRESEDARLSNEKNDSQFLLSPSIDDDDNEPFLPF